jgi:D-glycero-D-manno-heptose 1,7-bisphosphate phosphatase
VTSGVFLDKDGTVIPDIPYNVDPKRITVSDDVIAGLLLLQSIGYKLILVSNQPGIGLGYFERRDLEKAVEHLCGLLHGAGVTLSGFYYCPHTAGQGCECRKPDPGLLFRAGAELDIDLSTSWMIGDILNDVEAGKRAGCRTILIDNGNETEWHDSIWRRPDHTVRSMRQAAITIASTEIEKAHGHEYQKENF